MNAIADASGADASGADAGRTDARQDDARQDDASRWVKRRIATIVLIAAVPLLAGGMLLAGTISTRITTNSSTVVRAKDNLLPDGSEAGATSWAPDVWSHGRLLDPAARRAVAQVYARAWVEVTRGIAAPTGGIDPTFVGPALDSRTAMRPPAGRIGAKRHELQLRFYADNGAVVGVRAQTVSVIDEPVAGGILRATSGDTYDVVMTLADDGTWRVRQWDRVGVAPATTRVEVVAPRRRFPVVKALLGLAAALVALVGLGAAQWSYRTRRAQTRGV